MKVGDLVTRNKGDVGVITRARGSSKKHMIYRIQFAHEIVWLTGVNLEVI